MSLAKLANVSPVSRPGVLISNVILFFWLLARSLVGYALLVAPLPLVVIYFRDFARQAYGAPSLDVALDEAVARDRRRGARPRRRPTWEAPLSVGLRSFRLTFGRVIIARNGVEARTLFRERARAERPRRVEATLNHPFPRPGDRSAPLHAVNKFEANLYTQPALREQGRLDADAELELLLHDGDRVLAANTELDEDNPRAAAAAAAAGDDDDARRRPLVPLPTTPESDDIKARMSAMAMGMTRIRNLPDAAKPAQVSRAERRRVSAVLEAAYRGERDFFAPDDPSTEADPPDSTDPTSPRDDDDSATGDDGCEIPWPPPPPLGDVRAASSEAKDAEARAPLATPIWPS